MLTDSIYLRLPLDFWQPQPGLYFLAEASINDDILALAEGQPDSRLYWGELGQTHASVSPYLLPLDDWQSFAEQVAHLDDWGILIQLEPQAAQYPEAKAHLLAHLREWSWVTPDGQSPQLLRLANYFMLETLFEASNASEAASLWGKIVRIGYWQQGMTQVFTLVREDYCNANTPHLPHQSPQVLSAEQTKTLTLYAYAKQYQVYQDYLRQYHPQTLDWHDDELLLFTHRQILQARSLGFNSEQEHANFLSLAIVFGEDFSSQSWAQQCLQQFDQQQLDYQGQASRMDVLYQTALKQPVENN